jgi:hypothetical protein
MTVLAAHGISVNLPRGWEGRIFVPDLAPPAVNLPVMHLTDTVLTPERSSYGPELASRAGGGGTLVALVEFASELAGHGLYEPQGPGLPLTRDRFHPASLQVPSRVQAGHQRFFSTHGRAFCLYVVLGTWRGTARRLGIVNEILATLRIAPGAP